MVSLAAVSALVLSACSPNVTPSETASTSSGTRPASPPATKTTKAKPTPTSTEVDVPRGVVGAGCANYMAKVPTGPGSLLGMARDPVAVAISNSSELTTFGGALSGLMNSEVNMTEMLNKGQYTVFAPTDAAFGKLSPESLDKLRNNSDELTAVLKYHVVSGELDPSAVVGEQKTLQGQTIQVSGADDDLQANGAAVVCGGIKAANGFIYLLDTVLMPPPPPTSESTSTSSTEPTATPTP